MLTLYGVYMSRGFKDFSGQKIGKLYIESLAVGKKPIHWNCLCDCGTKLIVSSSNLRTQTQCKYCSRACGYRLIDLSGRVFGDLTVIERVYDGSKGNAKWLCHCSFCNNTNVVVRSNDLLTGGQTRCGQCRIRLKDDLSGKTFNSIYVIDRLPSENGRVWWKCRCLLCNREFKGDGGNIRSGQKACSLECSNFKGVGRLSSSYWCGIKAGAATRGLDFDINMGDCWHIFCAQKSSCCLSGVRIHMARHHKDIQTASLDRKHSLVGYKPDNVQWVHKTINRMKLSCGDDEFIQLCCEVTDYHQCRAYHNNHSQLDTSVPKRMFTSLKKDAKKRGLYFGVTYEQIDSLYHCQRGLCKLTGKAIGFADGDIHASLDRIDSSLGYTTDNIQWIQRRVNMAKNSYRQTAFIAWCRLVANYQRRSASIHTYAAA